MAGFAWGGSEELWAAAAREALAVGHRVVALVPRWRPRAPGIERLMDAGATVFERHRFHSKKLRRLVDRLTLRYWSLSRHQPELLCISEGAAYDFLSGEHGMALQQLTRGHRIPYVVVCQYNDEMLLTNQGLRNRALAFYGGAARVVFVAHHNRRLAERQLACRLPNAVVVQNPLILANTTPVPWRTRSETVRFCSVARLHTRHKGQDVLLEAFSASVWRQRPWELRLYGAGPDDDYLHRLAQMFDIADRVKFMGHVPDVGTLWAENDILVLSSYGEGTPLALMEAMLCGRPAVVTDVGGTRIGSRRAQPDLSPQQRRVTHWGRPSSEPGLHVINGCRWGSKRMR